MLTRVQLKLQSICGDSGVKVPTFVTYTNASWMLIGGRSFSSFSSFSSFCPHPASSAPLLLVPCRRSCLLRGLLLFAGCGRVLAVASHHCSHRNHRAADCQDEGPVWGETAASLSCLSVSSRLLSSEAPPAGPIGVFFPRALFRGKQRKSPRRKTPGSHLHL